MMLQSQVPTAIIAAADAPPHEFQILLLLLQPSGDGDNRMRIVMVRVILVVDRLSQDIIVVQCCSYTEGAGGLEYCQQSFLTEAFHPVVAVLACIAVVCVGDLCAGSR